MPFTWMNVDVRSKKEKKKNPVSIATNIINDLVIVSALEGGVKSAAAVIRWLKSHCYHKLLSALLNFSSELYKNDESTKQLLNGTIKDELITAGCMNEPGLLHQAVTK